MAMETGYKTETATSAANGYGAALTSAVRAEQQGSIPAAYYALEEARSLAIRVEDMVNRLCGSTPQAVGEASDGSKGPGAILPGLRQAAERTVELVRNA